MTTVGIGTLRIGSGGTTGSISGNIANTANVTFYRSNDLTYAGIISGTGALTKLGAGTLTLTGDNTFAGSMTINAGTVEISADANLGAGGDVSLSDSTLQVTATDSTNRDYTLHGVATFDIETGTTYSINGLVNSSGSLVKNGNGTLALSGANTYAGGTSVNAGTLMLDSMSAIGISPLDIATGNVAVTDDALIGVPGVSAPKIVTIGAGSALSTGPAEDTTIGSSGKVSLATGTISSRRLKAMFGSQLSGSGNVSASILADVGSEITATGNLELGNATAVNGFYSNGDLTVEGGTTTLHDANTAVFDSAALVTLGSGAGMPATLAAANGLTLDFGANITGFGTVDTPNDSTKPLVNNGSITGSSAAEPLTLNGYVKGVGNFSDVVINGTLAPGFSPAEISFEGDMTLGNSATLEIELAGTAPGSGHDKINVAGTATLNGLLDMLVIDGFGNSIAATDQFTVLDANTLTGAFTNVAPGARLFVEEFNADVQVDYGAGSPFGANQVVLSDFNFMPLVATWVAGASNWKTAANWDINQVPNNGGPMYDAIVPTGTAIVDAPIEIRALTLAAGGTVDVNNNLTVTQSGQFTGGAVDVAAGTALQVGGNVFFGPGTYTGAGEISPLGATVTIDNATINMQVETYNLDAAAETIIGGNAVLALNVGQIDADNTVDGAISINRGSSLVIAQSNRSNWEASATSVFNFVNSSPANSHNSISGEPNILQGTLNVNGGFTHLRSRTTFRSDPGFSGQGVARTTVNMNPQAILRFSNGSDIIDAVITGGGTVRFFEENNSVNNIEANVDIDIDRLETQQNGEVHVNGSNIRTGTIALDSGSLTLDSAARFAVSDVGNAPGAGLFVGLSGNSGVVTIDNGAALSTVDATIAAGGDVSVIDGTFTSTNAIQITGGQLGGAGSVVADVANTGGIVAPGLSPGILSETGNYTQAVGGTLAIEIGGTTLGTEYDQLAVTGTALIDGLLDIALVNLGGGPFSPALNDSFIVLSTTGGLSGTFSKTSGELPALTAGLRWQIDYDVNDVLLTVLESFTADFDLDGDVDSDDLNDPVDGWQARYGNDLDGRNFLDWQRQFGSGVPHWLPRQQCLSHRRC